MNLENEALANEVRSLLAVYEDIDSHPGFLETPLQHQYAFRPIGNLMDGPVERLLDDTTEVSGGDGAITDSLLGQSVGQYRLIRLIGRGGMGVVYEGERVDKLFKQRVAIKVIRSADTQLQARFHLEREAIARLSHPNIARLFDGGTTSDGRPYLVMEYVEGVPLDQYCDDHVLDLNSRLRIFQCVCTAVHHAHQHFVVHRDLKPSNILVDSSGRPKLLDFGIAKIIDTEPSEVSPPLTETASRMLTPEYASPEHIRGEAITVASDVYSLGVILYKLLSGHSPYNISTHVRYELERMICETDPAPPSTAVTWSGTRTLDDGKTVPMDTEYISLIRSTEPSKLRRKLKGDLDNIVLRSLRKERALRYPSAEALSDDISRFLQNKPVLAHKPSLFYRFSKFSSRNYKYIVLVTLLFSSIIFATLKGLEAWQEKREFAEQFDSSLELLETLDPRSIDESSSSTNLMLKNQTQYALDRYSNDPLRLTKYLSKIGLIYSSQGLHDEAKNIQEHANSIFSESHLVNSEAKSTLLHNLGIAYLNSHNLKHADSVQSIAIEIRRHIYGEYDPRLIESEILISQIRRAQGRLKESLAINSSVANRISYKYPKEHPQSIKVNNSLAQSYSFIGQLDNAEKIWRELLSISNENGYAQHIRTADMLNSLAVLLEKKFSSSLDTTLLYEAVDLLDRSISISAAKLRSGHPILANALNTKGAIFTHLRRFKEAELLHRESISIYKQHIDINHPNLVDVLANLAYSLVMQEEHDLALQSYEEAYALSVERFGPLHPRAAFFLLEQSYVLFNIDRVKAKQYAQEAVSIFRSSRPKDDSDLQRALMQLSKLEMSLGNPSAAEPLLRDVLAHRQNTLLEGDWRIGSTQSFLGESLMLQDKFEEATPLLLEGYETMMAARGIHDSKVLDAKKRLDQLRALQAEMAPSR